MDRSELDLFGDERTQLTQSLDLHRSVMVRKAEGLTQAQMAQTLGPSTLTMGGLIKHLALVEDSWFHRVFAGNEMPEPFASIDWKADPDWEFRTAKNDPPDELFAMYEAACERSRAIVAAAESLDEASSRTRPHAPDGFSLRWILVHMIEETARHAGHADLIRESIDGATGY